jgi:SAM-dependent methyltransferase
MARTSSGLSKKEDFDQQVAKLVGAGKPVALETVDFSDPNRPKTCLEVDFPIIPVNRVAIIEGNAGKPIYQMSKWWARRRSSVFRSLLLAAATKAPDDETKAAKTVWDAYYGNHQARGSFKKLKVADIFMGGGTTVVEGSRLGMQMVGNDLNPVAWFVVKNELAKVKPDEIQCLLKSIEDEVKPQIMPYYAAECPRGHKGRWTRKSDAQEMGSDFDPLALTVDNRQEYDYSGPETIYTFWAKHGPCQVQGCKHHTPLFTSPVMAIKEISIRAWKNQPCSNCACSFDIEETDTRMAPGVPLVVNETEEPFAVLGERLRVTCPHCKHVFTPKLPKKADKKKISLRLLVHPSWLKGAPDSAADGSPLGGSVTDTPEDTTRWNNLRASQMKLIEVRGADLPETISCPDTGITIETSKGTIPKRSTFRCSACGNPEDVLTAIKASGRTGKVAAYAIQGYCPECDQAGQAYGGRFFSPVVDASALNGAAREWQVRKNGDLSDFYPKSELPYGFMTHHLNGGIPNHGFTHWWTMFNPTQLLCLSQLLKKIDSINDSANQEYILGAFQQYIRNQNMFCFWDIEYDKLVPHMSNNNFHPKSNVVENCVFAPMGRGNWNSCIDSLVEVPLWSDDPFEIVSRKQLETTASDLASQLPKTVSSIKIKTNDPVKAASIECCSSSDLTVLSNSSIDLVITDPPFGGLLHYSELSDFFYVWIRLLLKKRYPEYFEADYTPKTLEAVSNKARHPEGPNAFYETVLTQCWKEAHRVLKPGGILAFTFHHSEEDAWVAVLESLFEAGFYLEATYPVRSDETKGSGEFGSRIIEYDIIHVCRKRTEDPKPVAWAAMRKAVLEDVNQLKALLEHHQEDGLPVQDLREIKRGKALEYYSRHYGQVWLDEDRVLDVQAALVGINELLQEDSAQVTDPIPPQVEPYTSQFLRMFDGVTCQPRDQVIKYFKGTGIAPDEFTNRGWCEEERSAKEYRLVDPLAFAKGWINRHRAKLTYDYDQALVLIGMCMPNSGLKAQETLDNPNFKPHPALSPLLDWLARKAATPPFRAAAQAAHSLLQASIRKRQARPSGQQQPALFEDL